MFMKLVDGRVYCLPEGYEVQDRSLDVIRFVLNPVFTPAEVTPHCLSISSRAMILELSADVGSKYKKDLRSPSPFYTAYSNSCSTKSQRNLLNLLP